MAAISAFWVAIELSRVRRASLGSPGGYDMPRLMTRISTEKIKRRKFSQSNYYHL